MDDPTAGDLFYPLNGTEHGSQPSLTTRDRELVSVLEVKIEPGDLNQRPLAPQSVTLPTLPIAGSLLFKNILSILNPKFNPVQLIAAILKILYMYAI